MSIRHYVYRIHRLMQLCHFVALYSCNSVILQLLINAFFVWTINGNKCFNYDNDNDRSGSILL